MLLTSYPTRMGTRTRSRSRWSGTPGREGRFASSPASMTEAGAPFALLPATSSFRPLTRTLMPSEHPLHRLRELCMALPEVTERLSHGEPTWFVQGKKTFVTFADHHHDDRLAFWCAA